MNEEDYLQGYRAACATLVGYCMPHLNADDRDKVSWVLERNSAIRALRELCEEFGDNDWTDSLHLEDIIDKHLGRHLFADFREGEDDP